MTSRPMTNQSNTSRGPNPDLDPTPEARIAMVIWSHEYAYGGLGSMGFWKSRTKSQQTLCRNILCDVARAAISHGLTLESLARHKP